MPGTVLAALTDLFKGPGAAECPFLPPNHLCCFNTWLGFPPPQILLIEWGGYKQVADHIGSLFVYITGRLRNVNRSPRTKSFKRLHAVADTEVCWDKTPLSMAGCSAGESVILIDKVTGSIPSQAHTRID